MMEVLGTGTELKNKGLKSTEDTETLGNAWDIL